MFGASKQSVKLHNRNSYCQNISNITKCHAAQVHVVVKNVENVEAGCVCVVCGACVVKCVCVWCVCVCVCVCVCGVFVCGVCVCVCGVGVCVWCWCVCGVVRVWCWCVCVVFVCVCVCVCGVCVWLWCVCVCGVCMCVCICVSLAALRFASLSVLSLHSVRGSVSAPHAADTFGRNCYALLTAECNSSVPVQTVRFPFSAFSGRCAGKNKRQRVQ